MYSVTNILVSDVIGDFFFIFLVNEDEGVVFWIGRIVLDPILTWVLIVFFAVSNGDV